MPLSGASETLVRRWLDRPENQSEWNRLRGALSFAEGFQFFAIQVSDPIAELFLEMLLKGEAEDTGVQLSGFDLSHPPEEGPMVRRLLRTIEGAPRPSWFYFRGRSLDEKEQPAPGDFFLYLNQKRDIVSQAAEAPFLLSLSPEGWSLFRQTAPDFWSIHTSVFRFGSAEIRREERVREASEEAFVWQTFLAFVALRFLRAVLPSPRNPSSGLQPPVLRDRLVDRSSEERTLRTWLAQPGARILVQGARGMGKTSLLRATMADVPRSYPDGIFYFSLRNERDVGRIMEDVVAALRPNLIVPLLRKRVLQAMFRDVTAEKRILIVLDDIENVDLLDKLRPSPPSSVLAAGRGGPPLDDWRRLFVSALEPRLADKSPIQLLPPLDESNEAQSGESVTAEALSQAALALVQEGNLDTAREGFAAAKVLALESGNPHLEALVLRHQAAFSLWTGRAAEMANLAQDVLRLNPGGWVRGDLSLLALLALSLGETHEVGAYQDLGALAAGAEYSVTFELRSLVRFATLGRYAEDAGPSPVLHDLDMAFETNANPRGDLGVWAWAWALRGIIQFRQKDLIAARESAESALRLAHEAYDWEAEAEAFRVLGKIQMAMGDVAEAENSSRRLLELRENLYSPNHEGVAWAALDLARLLETMGDLQAAESFYLRAVNILQFGRPATDRALADSLRELGRLLLRMKRFSEAETFLREALAVSLSLMGPADPSSVATFVILASVVLETGRLEEAEDLLRSALALQDHQQAPRSFEGRRILAATLGLLANVLEQRSQTAGALKILWDRKLPLHEEIGDVVGRAMTIGQIAGVLVTEKRYEEVLPLLRERLTIFDELGDIRRRAVVLGEIANFFAAQRRYDEALPFLREELSIFEKLGDREEVEDVRETLQVYELARSKESPER